MFRFYLIYLFLKKYIGFLTYLSSLLLSIVTFVAHMSARSYLTFEQIRATTATLQIKVFRKQKYLHTFACSTCELERHKKKQVMSSKYFHNSFEDYSRDSSKEIIDNVQIKHDSKIIQDSESFWSKASSVYKKHNNDDYTVFTGTAGIALLYLRKSLTDPSMLKEAVRYLNVDKLKNRRVTFLCGDAGPLAVGAVIHHKLKDKEEANKFIDRLMSMNTEVLNAKSELPNELLYGRGGYLYALLFVNTHISPSPIDDKLIKKIIAIILSLGKAEAKASNQKVPLMYHWHNKYYLGAAHGLSGILYILLQAQQYLSKTELHDLIKPSIEYLATMRYASGNFMSSLESDSDRLVQWCHGAPGFTHLFCKAYQVFKDEKYIKLALECGEIVWNRGLLKKGYSICHGVSGNGYTFLELFQQTRDPKHLYRAAKFAEWCIDYSSTHEEHRPDHPLSLFEGITGRLYFLEDMKDPINAKFPGYTL